MAEVRTARPEDADEVLDLARAMHAESERYRRLRFSEPHIRSLYAALVPTGGILVVEHAGAIVGMVVGMLVPTWFGDGSEFVASDLALYVEPEHRGTLAAPRLIRAFERWAVAHGAREVSLGVSTEIHAERTRELYERLGFKPTGYLTVKRT